MKEERKKTKDKTKEGKYIFAFLSELSNHEEISDKQKEKKRTCNYDRFTLTVVCLSLRILLVLNIWAMGIFETDLKSDETDKSRSATSEFNRRGKKKEETKREKRRKNNK